MMGNSSKVWRAGMRMRMRMRMRKMMLVMVMPWVLLLVVIWGTPTLASADPLRDSICPVQSASDSISGFRDRHCPIHAPSPPSSHFGGVTEGDEVSLQKALIMVHKNSRQYVAVLFYASWCPFSRILRPVFSILSYLYPSISHLTIEESSIRPSILSKYGVHGFPTLILLNSTMRVRYRDDRSLNSLATFYSAITGIKRASLTEGPLDKITGYSSNHEEHVTTEPESCPFTWARSPENLFKQETYLALATIFVLLRLIYFAFPTLCVFARSAWRSHIRYVRLGSLLEHPRASFNRVIQLFNSLKESCKKSNLQEGAMNARAWASKSLATVSIGDASSSRNATLSDCH